MTVKASDYIGSEVFRELKGLKPGLGFECDGCTMSPDSLFGVDIRPACLLHDYAYLIGGNEADRLQADRNLRDNIKTCVAMSPARRAWLAPVYAYAAGVYFRRCRFFGVKFFGYVRPRSRSEQLLGSVVCFVSRYFGR